MAAESGRDFGLFRTHPERPQRGHRNHGRPTGCPGVCLRPIGRRDFKGLQCGRSNRSPGGAGEGPGETAERDGKVEEDGGVKEGLKSFLRDITCADDGALLRNISTVLMFSIISRYS